MGEFVSLFMLIMGAVTLVGGAVFFFFTTGKKANFDGLKEQNNILKGSRDEWKQKATEYESEVKQLRDEKAGLIGENKTLREIATQTPEILQLTKVVTDSVSVSNKVANNVANLTNEVKKLIGTERKKSNG